MNDRDRKERNVSEILSCRWFWAKEAGEIASEAVKKKVGQWIDADAEADSDIGEKKKKEKMEDDDVPTLDN